MTARRDPDILIRAFLEEGQAELPDRAYDAVRAEIDHTRQRVVLGPWRLPNMSNIGRFAMAAAAVLLVAVVGIYLLPRQGGVGGPEVSPTAQPSATTQPSAIAQPSPTPAPSATRPPTSTASPIPRLPEGPLAAGTYFVMPFSDRDLSICGPASLGSPRPCPGATADDDMRFTFTVPDGWAGAPFNSIWLDNAGNAPPDGAGMIFGRGGWLHSDPCMTQEIINQNGPEPDVAVGPTVDDFASALADSPLLDLTDPVDVTLAGYSGKYIDLQVPSDISGCPQSYYPWEPGLYAQGPSHRWPLWILDVDGVRVVVQTFDYPGTSPQHQAELQAIVDSVEITP